MKPKFLLFAMLLVGMTVSAQTQNFYSKVRLRNVPETTVTEQTSILIQDADKIVKRISASALSSGDFVPLTGTSAITGTLNYQTDFSTSYTNRTLVDKAYVDNKVATISVSSPNFQEVTNIGSVTNKDITVSSYFKIGRNSTAGYFLGKDTGNANYSVFLGDNAGNGTTATNAVAIGYNAGYNSTGLTSSVVLGSGSGASANSTGSIFIGNGAGSSTNSTYGSNISIGSSAGNYNTGSGTVGIGYNALQNNTRSGVIQLTAAFTGGYLLPPTADNQFVISTFRNAFFNMPSAGNRTYTYAEASGTIPALNTTAPASATAAGVVGEIRVTSTYIYVCTATNTWVRAALATW